MNQPLLKGLEIAGVYGWPPRTMPRWHIDSSELKLPKKQPVQEGHPDFPFCLSGSRKPISHVKGALPASGCGTGALITKDRRSGQEAGINKSCYFFNLLPQDQTLFKFFTNWAPKTQASLSCQSHIFIVSFSKKCKSYLLWLLLRFHFYETSMYVN